MTLWPLEAATTAHSDKVSLLALYPHRARARRPATKNYSSKRNNTTVGRAPGELVRRQGLQQHSMAGTQDGHDREGTLPTPPDIPQLPPETFHCLHVCDGRSGR